jgi:hypothetical protein
MGWRTNVSLNREGEEEQASVKNGSFLTMFGSDGPITLQD